MGEGDGNDNATALKCLQNVTVIPPAQPDSPDYYSLDSLEQAGVGPLNMEQGKPISYE